MYNNIKNCCCRKTYYWGRWQVLSKMSAKTKKSNLYNYIKYLHVFGTGYKML